MTSDNLEREAKEAANELGDAAGELVGHLGANAARLVGGVIGDAAQVSRRWHELSLTVALNSLKTAARKLLPYIHPA